MTAGCVEVLQLRPGVTTTVTPEGDLMLEAPTHTEMFGPACGWLRSVLHMLEGKPCSEEAVKATAEEQGAGPASKLVAPVLDQLRAGGWLVTDVAFQGRRLYTIHPVRVPGRSRHRLGEVSELVLSRFAILHRDGCHIVVESPRAWCEIRIEDVSLLAVFAAFAGPARREALQLPLPAPVVERLLDDLVGADVLVPTGGAEDAELRLCQWSPFELWMHSRSRLDMRAELNGGWGATGWAEGLFDPLPARHAPFPGPAIELRRPDIDALRMSDPTLTAVVEDRRSVREHDGADPITVDQLGEFLYRCARVRGVEVLEGVEHLDRPFPSGGALHELELYPAVRRMSGLEPWLYHYDPHAHALRRACGDTASSRRLIQTAELATFCTSPQVVIVIAARFGRLMWKYQGMGYSAILKNVGVLYQTMYLVATAMGLGACGIGGGDATTFNEAVGLDYFEESVVGEFLLGTPLAAGST